MKKELHVCLCHDDDYVKFAAVLINSVITNSAKISPEKKEQYKYIFHLLCNSLSEDTIKKLKVVEFELNKNFECNIIYHPVDDSIFKQYKSWNSDGKISYATYLRLIIPDILDTNIDKCVYLDCDMLCYGDLSELFDVDLGNAIIAATPDQRALMECLEFKEKNSKNKFKHVFTSNECYFNAGLMVINLHKWRENNITQKSLDYLNKYNVQFPDQDVLNMIFYDSVKLLHLSWNYNITVKYVILKNFNRLANKSNELIELIKECLGNHIKINIYHYYGQPKPWWNNPLYITSGYCGHIEDKYLIPYLNTAYTTPVYGKYFLNTLSSNINIDNLTLFHLYTEHIYAHFDRKFNKLKNRYKKRFIISCMFHIIEVTALFYVFIAIWL